MRLRENLQKISGAHFFSRNGFPIAACPAIGNYFCSSISLTAVRLVRTATVCDGFSTSQQPDAHCRHNRHYCCSSLLGALDMRQLACPVARKAPIPLYFSFAPHIPF